ncbi:MULTISPECIES: haloacid dehalogenase type II [Pseudonocardia]|uniref:(S)-2-haloacid dehalogenase n=2 Tax=Pseudonocardia TaxID=1847 RepID=A0A1Y2MP11_PSEAH|nr:MULTISPECIES: haloacid dehalogenase type II [Pseudonocardia]OSY36980.1 (S)-2-haloacid dehalogenase [Pseudonocardia autotrophica]TDN75663.1 2-haloacid dehalogenase [Pseudonocardia autotrophica]BBF99635.1 haloacid dehalogenase [Pseudonocardia autotrophica]GEC27697.1 haloacid dehalogenase [Pseudonocardia saturnea]
MAPIDIDVVVFDVLGTLVDEAAGLRSAIDEVAPRPDPATAAELVARWQGHVATEHERIVAGEREFVPSSILDAEAAAMVARHAGIDVPADQRRLTTASTRLPPFADSGSGLTRLAERYPVIGLSNADRSTLLRLNAHAGLRWHQALSTESAATYKPAAVVYRLALDVAAVAPERVLMVAAHAWDLRGAAALGMRTAYVERPAGDPPTSADRFDVHATGLADLAEQL